MEEGRGGKVCRRKKRYPGRASGQDKRTVWGRRSHGGEKGGVDHGNLHHNSNGVAFGTLFKRIDHYSKEFNLEEDA